MWGQTSLGELKASPFVLVWRIRTNCQQGSRWLETLIRFVDIVLSAAAHFPHFVRQRYCCDIVVWYLLCCHLGKTSLFCCCRDLDCNTRENVVDLLQASEETVCATSYSITILLLLQCVVYAGKNRYQIDIKCRHKPRSLKLRDDKLLLN